MLRKKEEMKDWQKENYVEPARPKKVIVVDANKPSEEKPVEKPVEEKPVKKAPAKKKTTKKVEKMPVE